MKFLLSIALLIFVCVANLSAQVLPPTRDSDTIQKINAEQYPEYLGSSTLTEQMDKRSAAETGDLVVAKSPQMSHSFGDLSKVDLLNHLKSLTANSAAVIEGTPLARRSFACANNSFVCSDYLVRVDEVYRTDGVLVSPGRTIVVSRAGGSIAINGLGIRGLDPDFQLFHLQEPYVFYLALIPKDETFKVDSNRSFLVSGLHIVPSRTKGGIVPLDTQEFHRLVLQASQVKVLEAH